MHAWTPTIVAWLSLIPWFFLSRYVEKLVDNGGEQVDRLLNAAEILIDKLEETS